MVNRACLLKLHLARVLVTNHIPWNFPSSAYLGIFPLPRLESAKWYHGVRPLKNSFSLRDLENASRRLCSTKLHGGAPPAER